MWECVTSTPEHIDQVDGSSCRNSEKVRNSAYGTISAHCVKVQEPLRVRHAQGDFGGK